MSAENLSDDFKALGDNLGDLLRAAWDRPERKNLQKEVQNGLKEVRIALEQAASDFSESGVGQKIRDEVDDVRQRVERGEVEARVRADLQTALQKVNQELENLIGKIREPGEPHSPGTESG